MLPKIWWIVVLVVILLLFLAMVGVCCAALMKKGKHHDMAMMMPYEQEEGSSCGTNITFTDFGQAYSFSASTSAPPQAVTTPASIPPTTSPAAAPAESTAPSAARPPLSRTATLRSAAPAPSPAASSSINYNLINVPEDLRGYIGQQPWGGGGGFPANNRDISSSVGGMMSNPYAQHQYFTPYSNNSLVGGSASSRYQSVPIQYPSAPSTYQRA
jgi:hypothetical protein